MNIVMPATYTYNDAIDAAVQMIAQVANESGDERCFKLYIALVSRLEELKRPTRRKRVKNGADK